MKKDELIKTVEKTNSFVDIFHMKHDILEHVSSKDLAQKIEHAADGVHLMAMKPEIIASLKTKKEKPKEDE